MSKAEKRNARKARRVRRAQRNKLAVTITHHLIVPTLKPAELKKLLAQFAALKGGTK